MSCAALSSPPKKIGCVIPPARLQVDGIEHADAVELRGAQPARGAERKARQARGARFVHAMKGGGEAALGGEHIGPAFEELRGQTGGHGSGLARGRSGASRAGRRGSDW